MEEPALASEREAPDATGSGARPARKATRWFSWLAGVAVVAAVIAAALHFSEEREFVRLAEDARPGWLIVAVLLQVGTYLAQAELLRLVTAAAHVRIPLATACKLSLAKLFIDQALPSGGLSGTVVVARDLEQRGVPRGAVMAAVMMNIASYYGAYVLSLAAAVVITIAQGHASALIVAASLLFVVFGSTLALGVLLLSGWKMPALTRALARLPRAEKAVRLLGEADAQLVRSPSLISASILLQLAIVLLDAATVWVLVRSLGGTASATGVFASFMVSTLLRTLSVIPGGLGTFEAASVVTLRLAGVPVAVALSATLLFRGLSFWLPMLPGLVFSRSSRRERPVAAPAGLEAYWAVEPDEVLRRLRTTAQGLSSLEARQRLAEYGRNELREQRPLSRARVLWSQLRSPLLLLLVFAAGASALTGDWVDAPIVLAILVASVGIGYSREYRAQATAAELRARVRTRASVLRDGVRAAIPLAEVVPGDVALLSAGSMVPADAVVVEAIDCLVNEAVLTGESFPVEKRPGAVSPSAALGKRSGCVFLGTNVLSGAARCVVVETGPATQFGAIAGRLTLRPPETEFDRGVRHFGYLLTSAMSVLVLLVFAANVFLGRAPIETLLFSIALAVGLSPELLPVILTVNLARGAQLMAGHGVLVRRLSAIENLGSMDVLCTDKTGTLTEGVVRLEGAWDAHGARSPEVLELAAYNAALQAGVPNPLDAAILEAHAPDLDRVEKLAEVPYDFVRRRLSVVVRGPGGVRLVTKGAFEQVLDACARSAGGAPLDAARRAELHERFRAWSGQGIRVLAVAARTLAEQPPYGRDDERDLEFLGFLTFLDAPKEGVREAIGDLKALGVSVKLISGDAKLVAQHVASSVGLRADRVLTGKDLDELHDEALWRAAEDTDLFVEVDPNQKERIILSLKKMAHVVGFLGDGVNDAPAMHAADTSLSVEHAVDVAREAADFVLLDRHLDVIRRGIEEGRRTFANTLKYVLTTMSANLGNMMSMAVASMFLPFLPLLAGQILLNNFLSDIPAIGLAGDSVDREIVAQPRRWDMAFIGRFMIAFGILSSVFDLLTFSVLLGVFAATPVLFRTGWFVESLLTELVIALVVRTRRPFFRSRPGTVLVASTAAVVALTFAIPYLPHVGRLGFTPLPASVLAALVGITLLYVLATELTKAGFYRKAA